MAQRGAADAALIAHLNAYQDYLTSLVELQACLKEEAGVDWAPKRVQGLLAALDIDGDGKVQKEELVQSVQVLSKVLDSLVANKTTATASLDDLLMTLPALPGLVALLREPLLRLRWPRRSARSSASGW